MALSSAPLPPHTHHLLLEQSASNTPAEHIRTCQVAQSLNGKCPRASDREISEHIRHRRAETTAETNKSVYQHTGRRENCANKQHTPTNAETTAKQTALQGRDNCRTNNVMIAEKTAEQTLPRRRKSIFECRFPGQWGLHSRYSLRGKAVGGPVSSKVATMSQQQAAFAISTPRGVLARKFSR